MYSSGETTVGYPCIAENTWLLSQPPERYMFRGSSFVPFSRMLQYPVIFLCLTLTMYSYICIVNQPCSFIMSVKPSSFALAVHSGHALHCTPVTSSPPVWMYSPGKSSHTSSITFL